MQEYDFSNMDFDSFDGFDGSTEEIAESEYKLAGGASLAIVDADQAVCDYLTGVFGGTVDTAYSLSALEPQLGLEARVVILGPTCGTEQGLQLVEEWGKKYPHIATVLVTSDLSTNLLHQAMRSGVRDVLAAPIDEKLLVETVHRVAESLPKAEDLVGLQVPKKIVEPIDGEVGKLITVFSTKGGSGKSVTATNLGVVLARHSSGPVVIIDGHFQFGDIAVMLKLQQAEHSVMDVIARADELDSEMIEHFMTVHEPTGLMVLPAPTEPALADQVNPEDFLRVIEIAKGFAEHVIVDMPAFFNDVTFKVLEASDDIVLVTGLDIPNIKNVRIAMNTISMLGIQNHRVKLVLNRANSKVKLEVSEVERALGIEAAAHIPSDVVVPISVNKGSPVVLSAPKSGVARAFEEFALQFIDSSVAAAPASTGNRRKFFS